ncbi:Protein sidekick-1 [Acropora cervicornis]|uniref:Protein sidekick-1 n=1 Tax=Acropora cervicornis TaxID=6130 RepID=A0AAD9QQH8_ACRCE|nr:Protein sidekick-1 [Acropora cervicornis]
MSTKTRFEKEAKAPSASPANVRGNSTSTSIFVQWEQVPSPHQNGNILYYTVAYYRRHYSSSFAQRVVVAAPTTQTTLTGLIQGALYRIYVSASTSKGDGPAAYITIATGKNTEFLFSLLDFNGETKTTMKKRKRTLLSANMEIPKGRARTAMLYDGKDGQEKVPEQLPMVA